jgi:hypothetical protein
MKHIGILAITIYWASVGYILYKWGPDSTKTISDHVASGKQKTVYTPLAIIYLALFSWFMFGWFLPNMNSQLYHYIALTIGIVFLLLTFLIPRVGKYVKTHDAFANIVGCTIWFVVTSILVLETEGIALILSLVTLLCMMTVGIIIIKQGRKHYLQAQVFFFAMFHAIILLLTYTA